MPPQNKSSGGQDVALECLTREDLHAAAGVLRGVLASMSANSAPDLRQLTMAFRAVQRIRLAAQEEAAGDAQFTAALKEYHAALREWRSELPKIHGWLLAEKARLETRRMHTALVTAWLRSQEHTM